MKIIRNTWLTRHIVRHLPEWFPFVRFHQFVRTFLPQHERMLEDPVKEAERNMVTEQRTNLYKCILTSPLKMKGVGTCIVSSLLAEHSVAGDYEAHRNSVKNVGGVAFEGTRPTPHSWQI